MLRASYSLLASLYGRTASRTGCTGPPCQKVTKYGQRPKSRRPPAPARTLDLLPRSPLLDLRFSLSPFSPLLNLTRIDKKIHYPRVEHANSFWDHVIQISIRQMNFQYIFSQLWKWKPFVKTFTFYIQILILEKHLWMPNMDFYI
jgi:hypothetical protein